MRTNDYISKSEHILILVVSFATFVFAVLGFKTYLIEHTQLIVTDNKTSMFSGSADFHPAFLFFLVIILGFTLIALFLAKRFVFSSLLIISSFSMFIYWCVDTRNAIFENEGATQVEGIDAIFYKAGSFDLIVLVLLSILLFWQISILLRMLIKTVQRNKALP